MIKGGQIVLEFEPGGPSVELYAAQGQQVLQAMGVVRMDRPGGGEPRLPDQFDYLRVEVPKGVGKRPDRPLEQVLQVLLSPFHFSPGLFGRNRGQLRMAAGMAAQFKSLLDQDQELFSGHEGSHILSRASGPLTPLADIIGDQEDRGPKSVLFQDGIGPGEIIQVPVVKGNDHRPGRQGPPLNKVIGQLLERYAPIVFFSEVLHLGGEGLRRDPFGRGKMVLHPVIIQDRDPYGRLHKIPRTRL